MTTFAYYAAFPIGGLILGCALYWFFDFILPARIGEPGEPYGDYPHMGGGNG